MHRSFWVQLCNYEISIHVQSSSMFFHSDNYRYIMTTVVFQLYMAYFSLQTASESHKPQLDSKSIISFSVPLEFPILKRENFNRWYSTSAYFAAQTLGDLPVMFLCSTSYSSISFWMTNQPREIHRYLNFSSVMLAMCYASQGLGIVGSALLEVKVKKKIFNFTKLIKIESFT